MSLIAHRNLKAVKLLAATGRAERVSVALSITAHAAQAVSEARMHKAAIEAELYLNRYKHSSKNDDDLPIAG
jgi:hypothetical protein